jgi:hemoglobin
MQTLYERIGGQPTIKTLINAFYKRVFTDPILGPFFVHTSLEKLTRMQEQFFSIALDGPEPNGDISLQVAHQGRKINLHHMTRFSEHLLSTLNEVGVDEIDATDVVTRIASYSVEILDDMPMNE